KGAPTVSVAPIDSFGGDKQAHVQLHDHFVPDADVLDGAGNGLDRGELAAAVDALVALQTMEMVGGAEAVVERTAAYVREREQFGRPIGSFQAAQHMIADMQIALDKARLAAWQAAWYAGRGDSARRYVAIAKMHCAEGYKWITLTGHQ